ncbi:MAG: RNA polymerase factor sigma-54 [candidate division Zixibacteria bacterium]|nr:RNA polymerase factor sigma-54 [candidate division Zixibacteria bacterium]
MKLDMQMKLQQKLAPQLIQSLKLLQMPILKLEQLIRQELSTNPLLEEIEPSEEHDEVLSTSSDGGEDQTDPKLDKINWEDYLRDEGEFYVRREKEQAEEKLEKTPVSEKNLYEHLMDQLHLSRLGKEDVEIGEYIIGNIDENGYLVCSAEEIASALDVSPEKVSKILRLIQSFDPPGVGAGDLRESLLIQLKEKGFEESLAFRVVRDHLNDLEKKSLTQLCKIMGVRFEDVQAAMDFIKTLSPRPAMGRFTPAANPVVPDLIVEKIGDEFLVFHNDKNVPRLRINKTYRELMKKGSIRPGETKTYLEGKLEKARWLLNSINQRRSTMIKVMEKIVEEQNGFFEDGPSRLKPLTMEAIAERVGMNVATISRVSNGKYVQTPQGIFEIKYFFNTGVPKENGEELSKRHVKQLISDFIRKEDPAAPLSDQQIFSLLKNEGINIARRTVSKYREELKIMPARFRKRIVKAGRNHPVRER